MNISRDSGEGASEAQPADGSDASQSGSHFSAVRVAAGLERTVLTRPATPQDAKFIGEIRVSAWKRAYREFMPAEFLKELDPSANLEALTSALQSTPQPFHMVVAEVDKTCVGFAIVGRPRYEAPEPSAELWALNVHPAHWRGGVASKLVAEVLSHAHGKGFSTVELWCIEGNDPAIRLYEKCGFKPTGQRRTTSALTGSPLTELAFHHVFHLEVARELVREAN